MFEQVISENRRIILELLGRQSSTENFYLAEGTATALHLGHRISEDFDFFSRQEFETFEIIQELSGLGKLTISGESPGTIHGILDGVKLSFIYYKYPLLYPTVNILGCQTADIRDIAAMKMTAISGRGSKKDFFDLYFIIRERISLDELMLLFDKKYSGIGYSRYHLIKSLAYFEDAEREKNPIMLRPADWKEVKSFFRQQQKLLLQAMF
ncbi:MAG: hypothetical protein VR69_14950 [Peptococcaceae bacterium BRH_c4b]|nr:MAG: hypothetical protein VR69_14950 [Peptococcaceae bacterium BRH_c4b]